VVLAGRAPAPAAPPQPEHAAARHAAMSMASNGR